MKKQILAALLILCMVCTMLPFSAFAQSGRSREAVILALAAEYGQEQAKQMFDSMVDMGLIDEDGNSIIHKIEMDGREYTLEQMKEIISSPDVDLSKEVKVDDDVITLAVVGDMLAYEEFLKFLDENFVSNNVELTSEHRASLESLKSQIATSGIGVQTLGAGAAYENGIRHDVYVKATVSATDEGEVAFALYDTSGALSAALSYDVTFSYKTVDGSAKAGTQYTSKTGTVTFAKNQIPAAKTVSVAISDKTANDHADKRWNGNKSFFLYCCNIRNALFEGGKRTNSVAVSVSKAYDYEKYKGENLYNAGWIGAYDFLEKKTTYLTCAMSDTVKYAFQDGMIGGLTGNMSYDFGCSGDGAYGFHSFWINYFYVKSAQGTDIVRSEDAERTSVRFYFNKGNTVLKHAIVNFSNPFNAEQIEALRLGGTPMVYTSIWQVTEDGYNGGDRSGVSAIHGVYFGLGLNGRERKIYADTNTPETIAPKAVNVTAPDATFISGDFLPVTVEFSEPVAVTNEIKLTVKNGEVETKELTPVASEVGTKSKYVTFLYTVPECTALRLTATAVSGAKDIAGNDQTAYTGQNIELASKMELDNVNSITGVSLSSSSVLSKTNAGITVSLDTGDNAIQQNAWLTGHAQPVDGNTSRATKLYASIDGNATQIPLIFTGNNTTQLTGSFTAPQNLSGSNKVYQVELYMDVSSTDTAYFVPMMGVTADLTVTPVICADAADIIFNYPAVPSGQEGVLYLGETITLAYTYSGNATYHTADDFVWSSSDERVATIDSATGSVTPVGVGNVTFTLTNDNRGAGITTKTTRAFTISQGGSPNISAGTTKTKWKAPVEVRWSSNITYKNLNEKTPAVDTFYTIELYQGYHTQDSITGTAVASYTSEANASVYNIPENVLSVSSNGSVPAYTVKISAVYEGITYFAAGYIIVTLQPATVHIIRPEKYSILDTQGSVDVSWSTANADRTNGYDFLAEVYKDGALAASTTDANDTLSIPISDISGKLKDVYTITAKIKNKGDETWSYDSYILNVYDAEAMKILVDGAQSANLTMSNRNYIKDLTSAQIVALQRQIYLRNALSINHKEYDYGAILDQIEWTSSESETASINYKRGGAYENIEDYSYASYMPTTDFILAGHKDGNTTISATHKFTQLTRELGVTVETLKDRLYLFQFMPNAQTSITYKNNNGQIVTHTSDANGALAVYEDSGIQSDIRLRSEISGQIYLGTMYQYNLQSGENNGAKSELYPINNFVLRKAAVTDLYFKKPDGTPYTGSFTVNGGVYKNGNYCQTASISSTVSPDAAGHHKFEFDITKFWSSDAGETSADRVDAEDTLKYIFEMTFVNDEYEPVLIKMSGNLSDDEILQFGESIVNLRATTPQTRQTPVIFSQTQNRFKSSGRVDDVMYETGNIGISQQTPRVNIETVVLWWGKPVTDTDSSVSLYNETGTEIAGQTYKTFKYPFGTMLVTEAKLALSESTVWVDKKGKGKVTTKLYDNDGDLIKSREMPYTVRNLLAVQSVFGDPTLTEDLVAKVTTPISSTSLTDDTSDDFVGAGLDFIQSINLGIDNVSLMIAATKDPSVFNGILCAYLGDDVMDGPPNADGLSIGIASDEDKANLKGIQSKETAKTPTVQGLMAGRKGGKVKFQIGGYFAVRVKHNAETDKWEIEPIGGGIRAGIGYSYNWTKNAHVGPIPITAELELGIAARMDFDAHILYEPLIVNDVYHEWEDESRNHVTDYQTNLRVLGYIYAFGGLGYDFSVIALKIGVFGQIEVESNNKFLNRTYLKDTSQRAINGQAVTVRGQTGIKFVAKFLFLEYAKTLASIGFSKTWTDNNWENIEAYWNATTGGDMVIPMNATLAAQMYADSIGADMMEFDDVPRLESRNYLSEYSRAWNTGGGIRLFALDTDNLAPENLQENAYPYANPLVSDDGGMFAYLSDGDSASVWDTRASFAQKGINSKYENKGAISDGGFGDSALSFDGDNSFAAATWVRQYEKLDKDEGDEINATDIAMMTGGTEIVAGVYNGSTWTATRLTNDVTPDLAPKAATNGQKAIVAWRSVYPSDLSNPTDFSGNDAILYKIYDGSTWGDVKRLYNGDSGSVKALFTEMLPDGTSMISYVIDTSNENDSASYEVVYATVQADGDIINNVRLTNDAYLDENPQITTVNFGTQDTPEYRFILGWHRQDADGSDIRIATVTSSGYLAADFTDSLKTVTAGGDSTVGSNFKFAKNAQNVDELSILWTQRDDLCNYDTIKAMKFALDGDLVYTSSVIDVAQMPERTLTDHFDAYISDPNNFEVKAVILGTEYKEETENVVDDNGNTIPVPKSESKLLTATESYKNKAEITNVNFEYTEIKSGFTMPIGFTVENKGFEIISEVTITCGGTPYNFTNVNLYPGASRTLVIYYNVPASIANLDYSGAATFESAAAASMTGGTIGLAVPDVGIGAISTVKEEDGIREFSVPLYNVSAYKLKDSGKTVKLSVYADPAYGSDDLIQSVAITDNGDLEMIDNGAYLEKLSFHIRDYVQEEIPVNGVSLYAKAVVLDTDEEITEFVENNNTAVVACENLSARNNGSLVKIDVEQTNDAVTNAKLTLQNLKMAQLENGNVAVNLLSDSGEIIETQYLSNTAQDLINLGCEGKMEKEFTFTQTGADVQAVYFTANEDDMNSDLQALSITGTGIVFDKHTTAYTLTTNSRITNLTAISASANACVTFKKDTAVLREGSGGVAYTLPLSEGENLFAVTVTPNGAGAEAKTYTITITYAQITNGRATLSAPIGWMNSDSPVTVSNNDLEGFTPTGYEYRINSGEWQTNGSYIGGSTTVTTFNREGENTVDVRLFDAEGYYADAGSVKVQVDKTAPALDSNIRVIKSGENYIVNAAANDTLSGLKTVTVADENGNKYLMTLTNAGVYSAEIPAFDGTLTVEAVDNASNVSRASIEPDNVSINENAQSHAYTGSGISFDIIGIPDAGFTIAYYVNNAWTQSAPVNAGSYNVRISRLKDETYFAYEKEITNGLVITKAVSKTASRSSGTGFSLTYYSQDEQPQKKDVESSSFSDVSETDWYYEAVSYVNKNGLMQGTGNAAFEPLMPVTRGMIVTTLWRLENQPNPKGASSFADVLPDDYYAEAVAWATENGIVQGTGNNEFAPVREITREEKAVILYNYAKFKGLDTSKTDSLSAFSDTNDISGWASEAMSWAVHTGLISGKGNGVLDPCGHAVRAEAAVILYRLIELLQQTVQSP